MNKQTVKSIIRNLLFRIRQIGHDRSYHLIMRKNGIANKKANGEKEWIEKWSQFGLKAKPTQYRVFSHYIGNEINIVPEDICHDFIETILNPPRFRGYYADKTLSKASFAITNKTKGSQITLRGRRISTRRLRYRHNLH